MNEAIARLFDDFATKYRRGESPDVRAYLELAGDDRKALADLIDRFLQAVPARKPTEEEIVLMQARLEQEPPLLVLRRRRKLSREAVVDALVKTLALNPKKRDKVARYYHELEVGTLDPNPVSRKVWAALDGFMQANVRVLAGLRPPLPAVAEAYMREVRYLASWDEGTLDRAEEPRRPSPAPKRRRYGRKGPEMPGTPSAPRAEPERDEIDRLFTGES